MIERYNRAKPGWNGLRCRPSTVANSIRQHLEQLAFDELLVRTSHLDPRHMTPAPQEADFSVPPGHRALQALDGKITLLRVR